MKVDRHPRYPQQPSPASHRGILYRSVPFAWESRLLCQRTSPSTIVSVGEADRSGDGDRGVVLRVYVSDHHLDAVVL